MALVSAWDDWEKCLEPRLQSYADEDGSPLDSYFGSPLSRSPKDSEAALLDSAWDLRALKSLVQRSSTYQGPRKSLKFMRRYPHNGCWHSHLSGLVSFKQWDWTVWYGHQHQTMTSALLRWWGGIHVSRGRRLALWRHWWWRCSSQWTNPQSVAKIGIFGLTLFFFVQPFFYFFIVYKNHSLRAQADQEI